MNIAVIIILSLNHKFQQRTEANRPSRLT